jgi:hypothetical protein
VPDTAPPPNPLLEIVLTLVLPSVVLDQCSRPESLGPFWALVVSLIFPLGFGAWCLWKKTGWNVFSVLGFVTILLSGGLGLLKLDAFWFAMKESAMPVMLGLAFPLTHRFGTPLINALVMQPHLFNVPALNAALATETGKRAAFDAALYRASCGMGLGMTGSAIANFFLAMWLLGGKEPGSELFVKGIAKLNWVSLGVIGVPMMFVMVVVFLWLMKQIQQITGLHRDDLLTASKAVRRPMP